LDEVDFAVMFAETRADELVVVEAGAFAETYFLEGWPDTLEVRGEFVCCVWPGVGYKHSETVCQEKTGPGCSDHAGSDDADCFDCHYCGRWGR
jgi:hypothetical protein